MTGRVINEDTENQIAKQIEVYLQNGELPQPDKITLPFINGLFGTLYAIHVIGANEAQMRSVRVKLPTDLPKNGDELLQAARSLWLEDDGAVERTKLINLIVSGSTKSFQPVWLNPLLVLPGYNSIIENVKYTTFS
jgi:hypothetical protein